MPADSPLPPAGPPQPLAAALERPVQVALDELGVLTVEGADAESFLNGQLTIDVRRLAPEQWQLGAYCSPKGRVVAIFEAWRDGGVFHLVMPAERAAALASRLSRYVLRAKVRIRDDSASWTVFGLTGPGADAQLAATGWTLPSRAWTHTSPMPGSRLVKLPGSPRAGTRWLLVAPATAAAACRAALAGFMPAGAGAWWWAKIDAGLPEIFAATEERFVPQMLNLDVLGAVHFGKGCYPGQEVVARSQYLGKLRRRMMRGHGSEASAGDDVAADEAGAQPVGTVVLAAAAPGGGVDALLEGALESGPSAAVHLVRDPRVRLSVEPPPYALVNPTA